MSAFRRHYGGHPMHLLVLVASFALAGFAAIELARSRPVAVIVWLVGAAIVHDLVLLPLYAAIDHAVTGRWWQRRRALPSAPWLNYVRFPAAVSGVLLLIYLPSIARLAGSTFPRTTALSSSGYFARWLAVTGVLFLASAITYAVRLARSR